MKVIIILFTLLTIGGILIDYQFHLATVLSSKAIKGLAKELGSVSLLFSLLALSLFLIRYQYSWIVRSETKVFHVILPLLRSVLKLLRFWHPTIGMIAISLASFHSYLMFIYQLSKDLATFSGLFALLILLLVVFLGLITSGIRQNVSIRKQHSYISFVCIILILVHQTIA